jgi:hypothetical protein
LAGCALSPFFGYYAGRSAALTKIDWVVVSHPLLEKGPTWVLLSRVEGKLWVAPVVACRLESKVVSIDPTGATMNGTRMGPIKAVTDLHSR